MKHNVKLVILLFFVLSSVLLNSACNKQEYQITDREDGSSFLAKTFSLYHPLTDSQMNDIVYVGALSDDTVVVNCVEDKLYIDLIDKSGNPLREVVMDNEYDNSFCIKNGRLIIVSSGKVYSFSPDSSSLQLIAEVFLTGVYKIYPVKEGFIVATGNEVFLYSDEFNMIKSIKTDFEPSYYHPLIICSDGYYAVEDLFPGLQIYSLDFDSGSYEKACTGDDIRAEQSTFYGNYYLNEDKLLSADIDLHKINVIGDFNNMIVPQPRSAPANDRGIFILNDDVFFHSYVYGDGNIDIVRFDHDKDLDYSGREKIRIAGYGTKHDFALMSAVTRFNSSQDMYFAVVEDYSDNYRYGDSTEAQQRKAELLSRYSSEGMPDIFYGNDNDYQYMGRSGMVIDLSGYISSDLSDKLTRSVRDMMVCPNATYEVFSSYNLAGYWGKASVWESGNVSYLDADRKSGETGTKLYCQLYDYDIVDMAVRYETEYLFQHNKLPDIKTFESLLKMAVKHGLPSNETKTYFNTIEDLRDDQYLMVRFMDTSARSVCEMFKTLKEKAIYIGFPSLDGSCHAIEPYGCMAISSDSQKPDACWELISLILDDDIQRLASSYDQYPVNDMVLNEYINNVVDSSKEYPEEYKAYIMDMIGSLDTVITWDWGIFCIFYEEVCAMDNESRDISHVAEVIDSRYRVYVNENYG